MQKARITIRGLSPYLQHRFQMEKEEKKKDKVYIPEEDATKALYVDATIGCYVPASHIKASMREAAKNFAFKKSNYKNAVVSGFFIDSDKIPLGKKTYDEIDQRPVVVQRQRVVRSRPKFNNWELTFEAQYDTDMISSEKVRDILIEAGTRKGIGDYRPEKSGDYGRFEVINFADIVCN